MSAAAAKTLRALDAAEQALTQQRGHAPSLAELAAQVSFLSACVGSALGCLL
jgi:hypothetical protein